MTLAAPARIALAADRCESVEDVRRLLDDHARQTRFVEVAALRTADLADCELLILEGGHRTREMEQLCRRLRSQLGDHFVPILLLTEDPAPAQRQACLDAGIDAYLLRPFAAAELLAQVRTFLHLKRLQDRLTEKSLEIQRINDRLQETHQSLNQEVELARRLQQRLAPSALPVVPGVRFAVHHRPGGHVGGDFHDVFRLDEHTVGLYLADGMGHGITASLLTFFLKNLLQSRNLQGLLASPDLVLRQLNHELVQLGVSDLPFLTMIYAVYDLRTRTVRFARAGHPHPVYVPHDAEPVVWSTTGSLLGVFETTFNVETRTLRPGDRVVFYTDGLTVASAPEQALANRWRAEPLATYLESCARELATADTPKEDVTLLGLEVTQG